MKTLRVAVCGLRVQEARRYHVSVQVFGLPAMDTSPATKPDQVARTETSEPSRNPEFAASAFVLRLRQPLASGPTEQPLLRVDLFAAPSHGGPGAGAGGREADELVGSGVVQCRGDVTARLLRGERVTVPVVLDGSGKANAHIMSSLAMEGGPSLALSQAKQVLLELLLLDACLTLPRDAFEHKSSLPGTGGPMIGSALPGGQRARATAGQKGCQLLVLVSRAENLPRVLSEDGYEVEPDTFVAARGSGSASAAQAVTRVAARSCRPEWNQVLTLRIPEAEVPRGQLLLAVVNGASSRLLFKVRPLRSRPLPRRHGPGKAPQSPPAPPCTPSTGPLARRL
ncbi:hypothetical protein TSOC_001410 [Tetrabaena socialis]|uniref:C2 domain-containing protein n=1 Tax=Tetrabaena socialis TaxID=47790 RepID=A0A2J8AGR7_9CHLO|nr:hypothetical protein TSOC_001410 [Tetrabaena socialis]|eukprot:PNH11718.1 hypothetical protein TSOC_001410 [Tetrabaena socialis]